MSVHCVYLVSGRVVSLFTLSAGCAYIGIGVALKFAIAVVLQLYLVIRRPAASSSSLGFDYFLQG